MGRNKYDPVDNALHKGMTKLFGKPKPPGVTQDQLDLEAMQKEQVAKLDAAENERRKRLLNAAQGIRAYAGSPIFRAGPSDTAGAAPAAIVAPRGGGAGAGAGAGNYGGGGRLGRAGAMTP